MVASRQSFPVVARERCLQTICHCVRYPCLVGSVLLALSAVGVARLRDVDHDPGTRLTRLTAQSQFLLGFKGLISRHELIQIQSVPRPNLVDSMKVAAVYPLSQVLPGCHANPGGLLTIRSFSKEILCESLP